MKEDFLHYIWKFKKFDTLNLRDATNQPIQVFNSGYYLQLEGPDFFNAQIQIGDQKWAGNVEIHIKSSDWYIHNHETDEAYQSVILHVVWEHDSEIFRKDNSKIPVLELKKYVDQSLLEAYEILKKTKSWIFCENQLGSIKPFTLNHWLQRLYVERLERKSNSINELVTKTHSDWEAVLFCLLAKNFGLNTNGELFYAIAQEIPFSIIRKEHFELENLEAIFFAKAGLLSHEKEDLYFKNLVERFSFLENKYQLFTAIFETPQFFKHRPDNFPTIRLAQLASLYHEQQNLFVKIIEANSIDAIYDIFKIVVSDYWQTHYIFDKSSTKKSKVLSKAFINLLIINTIVPIKFAYATAKNEESIESLIGLLNSIPPENNAIVQKFNSFHLNSKSAFETQAVLQLKNEYCNKSRCLECAIGIELLKK